MRYARIALRPGISLPCGALALFILLPAGVLRAQAPVAASDPFAELHAGLERAFNFQLLQAEEAAGRTTHPGVPKHVLFTAGGSNRTADRFRGASPALVEVARRRLLALGVDAAGIFAEEGVPLWLLWVARVESNFDPLARSPKGARGVWQLMPETAARYGLRVSAGMDERLDVEKSTRAAARYLRALYLQFGNWWLALAAYNAGEARVAKAIRQASTGDFWQLANAGLLPEETRRYVPAVLAASRSQ
jgi:hypothetical protein